MNIHQNLSWTIILLIGSFSLLCCKSTQTVNSIIKEGNLEAGLDALYQSKYSEMIWQNPHKPPTQETIPEQPPLNIDQSRAEENNSFTVSKFNPLTNHETSYTITYNHEYHIVPNKDNSGKQFFNYTFSVTNKSNKVQQYTYLLYYENETYQYDVSNLFTFFKGGENFYGSETRSQKGRKVTPKIKPGETKIIKGRFQIEGDPRGELTYRWRNPPRMGSYQFQLVVAEQEKAMNIPNYLWDIKKPFRTGQQKYWNGNLYLNPMLLNQDHWNIPGAVVVQSSKKLKLSVKLDLKAPLKNTTENAAYSSPFSESAFNHRSKDANVDMIPEVVDFDKYTQVDYERHRKYYESKSNQKKQVRLDYNDGKQGLSHPEKYKGQEAIKFYNPGAKTSNLQNRKAARFHSGVRKTALKYGKYRAKILFPDMLNKHGVWNGLHNTFWFAQASGQNVEWNKQSCNEEGTVRRTEFDIEFMDFTPSEKDRSSKTIPNLDMRSNSNYVKAVFSNFDFQCELESAPNIKQYKGYPFFKNIDDGEQHTITYAERGRQYKFDVYRHSYGSTSQLSIESLIKNDKLFGDNNIWYYEIEWHPTELIWRWGRSPDRMEVVAYMNSTFTSIPHNVMTMVIAQHALYRGSGSLYSHRFLPVPMDDINGYILDVVVE